MKPDTPLTRVPRDSLPSHLQASWDDAQALHGDTTFVELVRLRLANVHGCAFCNRADTRAALAAGVSQEQVDALSDYEQGPFSDQEKAALVELGVIMAVLCGMAKMIFAYDLVEKEDYCPFTPEA